MGSPIGHEVFYCAIDSLEIARMGKFFHYYGYLAHTPATWKIFPCHSGRENLSVLLRGHTSRYQETSPPSENLSDGGSYFQYSTFFRFRGQKTFFFFPCFSGNPWYTVSMKKQDENAVLAALVAECEAETLAALGYPPGSVLEYIGNDFEVLTPESLVQ